MKSYFHVEYQTDSNWNQISHVNLGVELSTELFEIWLTSLKIEYGNWYYLTTTVQ